MHKQGHLLVRHNKGFEMQSLQRVPCRQTIQFLEPNSLCPAAKRRRCHLPIQKQEKTAQRVHRRFGLRQVFSPYCRSLCNQRANKSTRNI